MTVQDAAARPTNELTGEGGRPWLMLTTLLLGQLMGVLDVLIVNVAMPEIGADLHASGATLQLVVGGYTVAYAMLLVTGARLGDLYGRRRMYLLGVVLFTMTSLACGLAPNSLSLVIFRFLQGAGAAVMVPQIMSVIQMRFSGAARAKALSAYGAVLSTGAVLGLVVGGVLVNADLFGATWRPVFLVNVPIGLLLMFLVPKLVPADEARGTRRLDFLGLAIATPAVFLVVLPLVLGRELGWPVWAFVGIALGLVLAGVFVTVERRIAAAGGDPLVNLAVLKSPGIGAGMSALTCSQVAYGGFLFIFTLHLESGLGDGALQAGLTYIPMAATFGLLGFTWRKLPAGLKHLMAPIGAALCAVGYVGIAVAMQSGGQDSALMWVSLMVIGAGLGFSAAPVLTQALVAVPMRNAADASGVLTTTVQLGQVIGVAAFGTLFLALYTPGSGATASAGALTVSSYSIAILALVGVVAGLALSRSVVRTQRERAAVAGH